MERYPSLSTDFTWVMRFGSTSMTVTGTVSQASVKMRVMPALRPIRATLMTFLSFVAHAFAHAVRVALQLVSRAVARPSEVNHGDRGARTCPRCSSGLGSLSPERPAQPRPISLEINRLGPYAWRRT